MSPKINSPSTTSKSKGNRYERQEAKKLSIWMFNSPTMLYRHEDSGARKSVYSGDITPKDADNFHWKIWPFIIELKNGYEKHIPTLMNQTKLRSWIVKLLSERTDTQKIPLLICQFHQTIPILLTNIMLNANCDTFICQQYENIFETFYIYKYNELLELDFFEVMPNWFPEVILNMEYPEVNQPPIIKTKKSKRPTSKIDYASEQIGQIIDSILL